MQSEKTAELVEAVKNMTDYEAGILEVFISGFRAGKQVSEQERNGAAMAQTAKPG